MLHSLCCILHDIFTCYIFDLKKPKSESDSADPLSLGDSQNDRRSKFIEIRSKIINEKLEKMSETEQTKWSSMKQEIRQVNEIQSRSLGKKKLNNCKFFCVNRFQ